MLSKTGPVQNSEFCFSFSPPHHDMYSSGAKSRSAVCSVILYSVRAALVFVGSGTGCSDGKLTELLAEVAAEHQESSRPGQRRT